MTSSFETIRFELANRLFDFVARVSSLNKPKTEAEIQALPGVAQALVDLLETKNI